MKVRQAALLNPNASLDMIEKGATDPEWLVRKSAMQSDLATPELLWSGFEDEDWGVQTAAVKNPKADLEMLELAAKSDNKWLRKAAASHHKTTNPVRKKATADGSTAPNKMGQKPQLSRTQQTALAERAGALQFSDLLATQAASKTRLQTTGEVMAAAKRVMSSVEEVNSMGQPPNLFGWTYSFLQA